MESYSDTSASTNQSSSRQSYESYKKVEVLGKGSFGKAFLVQCSSDQVGIKQLSVIFIESGCDKED